MTHKKIISFILIMIFVVSCCCYCFANTEEAVQREVHIDAQVLTELESNGETYVVIWIEDIDKKELLKRVEENTGLTEHNLIFGDEKANTDLYISEKRRLGKEMRSAKVTAVVNDLQFPEEKMIYQGSYVPIIIVQITEGDLNKLKLHDKIVSVEYISEEELFATPQVDEVLRGDVNDDGQLTAEDALGILQEAAKLEPKHGCTGDYNMDGQVTAEDALGVLREAAKL